MGGNERDEMKERILDDMAKVGAMYEDVLAAKYRDSSDPQNELLRFAVAALIREDNRPFLRRMLIRVLGMEGGFDQAQFLSLFLDSSEKPNFNYPSRMSIIYGGKEHVFDGEEKVREDAIGAIMKILSKSEVAPGVSPLGPTFGDAVVKCALFDHSQKIREIASEMIWRYGDGDRVSRVLEGFMRAEMEGNLHVYANAEEAVKMAPRVMANTRVRKTAVVPLIRPSLEDGKAAALISNTVVRIAGMESRTLRLALTERENIGLDRGLSDDDKARKTERINALIERMRLACKKEDEVPVPKKMKEAPEVKPTRNMRPLPVPAEKDEGPVYLPGDRFGNWWRERKYRKAQKAAAKAAELEKKLLVRGKPRP